jgi:8-oxo-dGTP diphosphatase
MLNKAIIYYMIQYNFCPKCGNKIDKESNPPHCSNCEITYYRNAKPGAAILPVKDGKVLLARRGRDPYKGAYDAIGGFMEESELPEDAAIREAKEETGLDIKITSLLGMYVDQYGDDGDYTLNIHYVGEVVGGEMKAMDDVASLEWVAISDLPLDEGFQNTKDSLRDLKLLYEN